MEKVWKKCFPNLVLNLVTSFESCHESCHESCPIWHLIRFTTGNEAVDFFKTIIDENCAKPGV